MGVLGGILAQRANTPPLGWLSQGSREGPEGCEGCACCWWGHEHLLAKTFQARFKAKKKIAPWVVASEKGDDYYGALNHETQVNFTCACVLWFFRVDRFWELWNRLRRLAEKCPRFWQSSYLNITKGVFETL